jgi:photosystem II PsbT protein
MEALVYTFLLIGTLMVIFFAVFFRETPRIIINLHDLQTGRVNFLRQDQKQYK